MFKKVILLSCVLVSLNSLYAMGEDPIMPSDPGAGQAPEPASTLFVVSALGGLLYKKRKEL